MNFSDAFTSIAKGFSSGGGGPYFDGLALWPGTPTKDAGGAITAPGEPSSVACLVQVDSATELMRKNPDYRDGDVRLIVIDIENLDTDAQIKIEAGPHAGIWMIETITRDPTSIGFDCRGRKA